MRSICKKLNLYFSTIILATALFGMNATTLLAEEQVPLGSEQFYPSPERPIGWRGDGNGHFPGATPPRKWSRQLNAVTSEIIVQANKPDGEPSSDKKSIAYFTVKDWLITGPFSSTDPLKDIEHDFLNGEATLQPSAGDKVGEKSWTYHCANGASQTYRNHNEGTNRYMFVDFLHAYGELQDPVAPSKFAQFKNADNQVAYAHTYLHAPRACEVNMFMLHSMPALRIWINGEAQDIEKANWRKLKPIKVQLKQGWNRLLVKAICATAQRPWRNKHADPKNVLGKSIWRFATYIQPIDAGPYSYKTENISWMLKLTGRNTSQPIVVGDNLYVGSGDTDLFCLDKVSGKIKWLHTTTYWDVMTAEQRAALDPEARALFEKLQEKNASMLDRLNAHISAHGLNTDQMDAIDKMLDKRNELARNVHRALSEGKKGKLFDNEVSAGNATPCSDGKRVYWLAQGNGGYLTSAFDLDGKKIWSSFDFQGRAGEHGSHRSPILCEGRLLVSTNEFLIAYDPDNGKELWRTPGFPSGHGTTGSPMVVEFNGKTAIQTQQNLVSLDGKILNDRRFFTWGTYIPVVENGILYNPCYNRGGYSFRAMAIAGKKGINWHIDKEDLYGPYLDNTAIFYVASPLLVDELLYQVDLTGLMLVVNTRERKLQYRHMLDGYNVNDRRFYGYCASPTLAGKDIYMLDSVGHATILKPNQKLHVTANNSLQNLSNMKNSGPGKQEAFYGGMYFQGKRMFVHSDNYLYCIMEDGKGLTAGKLSAPIQKAENQETNKADKIVTKKETSKENTTVQTAVHARHFRGSHYGAYPQAKIPLEWSDKTKAQWSIQTGEGYGSPVITGNHALITSEPDKLHCIDIKNGKLLWTNSNGLDQLPKDQVANAPELSTECGFATPSPYTDGKRVWVNYGTGVVACYDLQGKRQWIKYINKEAVNEYGRSASPVMADGKLIVTITHLIALDPETGKTLWEQDKSVEAYGTPAVSKIEGKDVLITPSGQIIDASTGKIITENMGSTENGSPVIHNGVVYFCDMETSAWALPKKLIDKPKQIWLAELSGEFFGSPVLHKNILYCISNDGTLYALDANNGKIHYEEILVEGDMAIEFDEIYPSLVLANDMLLVTNNPGDTAVIKPGPQCQRIRVNKLAPGSGSTPAVAGNALFIHSGTQLFCFGGK